MKLFGKLFFANLCASALMCMASDSSLNQVYNEAVVATVGNEVITSSDISQITYARERELLLNRSLTVDEKKKLFTEWRIMVLENLIEESLLFQEFAVSGFQVPENLIIEEVNRFIDENCSGSRDKYYQYLRSMRLTEKEFRDRYRRRLAIQMLKGEQVFRAVDATDREIEDYFKKNKEQFCKASTLHLGIIFLTKEGKHAGKELNAVAAEIAEKYQKGEDFAELAKTYSDDAFSAAKGGDMGEMPESDLDSVFIEQVKSLEVGKLTPPFVYADGLVILKLINRQSADEKLSHEVYSKIRNIILNEKAATRRFEYINELTKRHFVQIFVSGTRINNSIIQSQKDNEESTPSEEK